MKMWDFLGFRVFCGKRGEIFILLLQMLKEGTILLNMFF